MFGRNFSCLVIDEICKLLINSRFYVGLANVMLTMGIKVRCYSSYYMERKVR